MNITVNEQAQAFWLAYPDSWKNAVGHEIKVGGYQFCATPNGKKIKVSEITTGTKLFEYQIDPLTWLVAATKEGYINYLHVVGERIAEIISGSKNFDREFERMKKASFEMLGALPPIENVDLGKTHSDHCVKEWIWLDKEKIDELWALVKHVGDVDRLDDGAMLALGSVFGQMRAEIMRLQKENTVKDTIDINEYEAVPYTIALDWESERVWLDDHVTKRKFVLTEKDSWRIARNFELIEKF